MNQERWIYLTSLENLIARPELNVAYDVLRDWTGQSSKIGQAAGYYVTHFVIPSLQGVDCSQKALPRWVDRELFHPPPPEPKSIVEWLALFPGTKLEALYEREVKEGQRQPGSRLIGDITAEDVEEAKNTNWGLFCPPNGYSGRRNSENVDKLNAFFADFDDGTKEEQMEIIRGLSLRPTIIVETGKGHHIYWLLDESGCDKEKWTAIQKSIIKRCGTDPKISNPDRLMRVPFSWHTKTDEKKFVTIKEYSESRYTWADVERAFPPEQKRQFVLRREPMVRDLRAPVVRSLEKNHRHPTLKEEVGRIYAGLPENQARGARETIKVWYKNSCNPLKSNWEQEADSSCNWVEQKQYGHIVL